MAKVMVTIPGKPGFEMHEAGTVGELKQKLALANYSANVNGDTAGDDYEFSDKDDVVFATQTKGA